MKSTVLTGILLASAAMVACGGGYRANYVADSVPPPPAPYVVGAVGYAPGPGYVWQGGYHRWDGNAYAWNAGRWAAPPRPGARWVAHRWVRRHGGYVFVEGRWR